MYCIVARDTLKKMNGNRGKLVAQAGHAYLHAFWDSDKRFPHFADYYCESQLAIKICVAVDSVEELIAIEARYRPWCGVSLVTDAGLTCFDGVPTVTCLGIGPIADGAIGDDLKSLKVFI